MLVAAHMHGRSSKCTQDLTYLSLAAQVISSQTAEVEVKAKAAQEKEASLKTESEQISLDKVRMHTKALVGTSLDGSLRMPTLSHSPGAKT